MKLGFYNHKGGPGKTTLSVHCAFWCAENKVSAVLVDCDPQYHSIKWFSGYAWNGGEDGFERNSVLAIPAADGNFKNIPKASFYFVDLPPVCDNKILKTLKPDVWICPMDGRLSIEGAADVIGLVNAKETKAKIIGVMNKSNVLERALIGKEEIASAKKVGLDHVFDIRISQSDTMRRAEIMGKAAWDVPFGMRSRCAQNIRVFCEWVMKGKCDVKTQEE